MLFAAMCCSATIVQRRVASSLDPLLSSRARPAQGSYTRTLAPSREQSASLGQDHSCPRCVGRLLFICCFTRESNQPDQPGQPWPYSRKQSLFNFQSPAPRLLPVSHQLPSINYPFPPSPPTQPSNPLAHHASRAGPRQRVCLRSSPSLHTPVSFPIPLSPSKSSPGLSVSPSDPHPHACPAQSVT